ncbi:MAG TPA: hypothetical protein VNW89_08765 [Stellaceae bacterium]|nr:hypothetical protein [Stellaceae bacterium]
MPEFAEREPAYAERKRRELAPAIEAAIARKPRLPPLAEAAIPVVRGSRAAGRLSVARHLGSRRRDPDRDRRSVGRTPRPGRGGGSPRAYEAEAKAKAKATSR